MNNDDYPPCVHCLECGATEDTAGPGEIDAVWILDSCKVDGLTVHNVCKECYAENAFDGWNAGYCYLESARAVGLLDAEWKMK